MGHEASPFFYSRKSKTMTTLELATALDSFKPFYSIHQYRSIGESHLYLSDGCHYLLIYSNISWLFDIIFDFHHQNQWHPADHIMWRLQKQPCGLFDLRAEDFFKKPYYEQYDINEKFPLDEFMIFNSWWKVYLPSEV